MWNIILTENGVVEDTRVVDGCVFAAIQATILLARKSEFGGEPTDIMDSVLNTGIYNDPNTEDRQITVKPL